MADNKDVMNEFISSLDDSLKSASVAEETDDQKAVEEAEQKTVEEDVTVDVNEEKKEDKEYVDDEVYIVYYPDDGSDNGRKEVGEGESEGQSDNSDKVEEDRKELEDERDRSVSPDYIGVVKDEVEVFDPNQPDFENISNKNNSVSFEQLQERYSNKEDPDNAEFEDVSGIDAPVKENAGKHGNPRQKFMGGGTNKGLITSIIIGTLMIFLVIFYFSMESEKSKEESSAEEKGIIVGGTNTDWGDWKARRYEKKAEEVRGNDNNQKLQDKIDEIEERKGNSGEDERPTYQATGPQTVQNEAYQPNNGQPNLREEGMKSSLRPNVEGFGYADKKGGVVRNSGVSGNQQYGSDGNSGANEYLNNLSQTAQALGTGGNGSRVTDSYDRSNNGRFSTAGQFDASAVSGQVSLIRENSIYPGTIIHAVMINGINTDYPGFITARVINNVYDSKTGKHLLIPQGSILRGSYSSSSIGVSRVQIAWQTLILNRDGVDFFVNLGSQVGVDKSGYSGIKGTLNDHAFEYLKAAGISALFTYINSNIYEVTNAQTNKTLQDMISESQSVGNRLADRILDRALDIQPTVIVRPGTRVSVDVNDVLTLIPYDIDVPVSQYMRK